MDEGGRTDRDHIAEVRKIHHQTPRWVLLLILAAAVVFTVYHAAGLVVVLLFSVILAYILNEAIKRAEIAGLSRNLSVLILYAAAAGALAVMNSLVTPVLRDEINSFVENLPVFEQKIEHLMTNGPFSYDETNPLNHKLIRKVLREFFSPGLLISKTLNFSAVFSHAASFLFSLVLIPFFTFFLLRDWPKLLKKIMKWVPSSYVETTAAALSEIDILSGRYIRGVILDCMVLAVIVSLSLKLMGINYPISLGILSGAANVIPYLGPVMACTAASIIAFIQFESAEIVVNIVLFYILIKVFDDVVLQPLTIGTSVHIHPMLLIISIIVGQKLFGIIGMIIAVPVVTISQKVFSIFVEQRSRRYITEMTRKSVRDSESAGISHIPL